MVYQPKDSDNIESTLISSVKTQSIKRALVNEELLLAVIILALF